MAALSVLVVLFSTRAIASQALLEKFFVEVSTLEANFEQRVTDETGMLLEFSTGRFSRSRPGKFRWDYEGFDENPEKSSEGEWISGQQIIADGKSIIMYDPDLEQVTQRSLENAIAQVPSLLLVQSGAHLNQHFNVTDFGLTDGLSWVSLKPTAEDAGYQQLMIGFLKAQLNTIQLLDGLGNETRLSLSSVKNNPTLPDDRFEFGVPEGADLLLAD
jgi:outer membrane lipoprotein carrier protein